MHARLSWGEEMKRSVLKGVCAGLLFAGLSVDAEATSWVKTPQECTRYGGTVSRSNEYPGYHYACETPARDAKCVADYDEDYYFDAEYGKCIDAFCLDLGGTESECAE